MRPTTLALYRVAISMNRSPSIMSIHTTGENSHRPIGWTTRHRLHDRGEGYHGRAGCFSRLLQILDRWRFCRGPGFYELYWKRRHTSHQAITAGSVSFNRDSGTQNKIKFKIDDVVGNAGESDEYAVNIDAADLTAPMISSPTNLDGGVGATEMLKSDWYVWLIATKNRG